MSRVRSWALASILLFLTLAVGASSTRGATPANPAAGDSARAVLDYLAALPARPDRRVISAQHLSHASTYSPDGYANLVLGLEAQTGHFVGMIAVDYGLGDSADIAATNQILIDYWTAGGLITIDAHPDNPWTGGDSWDLGQRNLVELITPGSTVNAAWTTQLDRMAAGLAELRDAGVVVLWRPFHEMTFLSTFWWDVGTHYPDIEPWRAMWRHMFDYFTQIKGLDNLLWVYAAANEGQWRSADLAYPGDAYVDIVGVDVYDDEPLIYGSAYQDLLATGKPFALTECGPATRDGSYDNTLMIDTIRDRYPQSAYALHWHSWPGAQVAIVDNSNASAYLSDPWIITRDEIDWQSSAPTSPVGRFKLDEAGGTLAADSSGHANHGTVVGDPDWAGGMQGGSIRLDGTSDFVELPDAAELRDVQEGDFTLAAWYRPDRTPPGTGGDWNGSHGIVVKNGFHLGLRYNGDNRFHMDHWLAGDVYVGISSGETFPPGRYYHVAGVLDQGRGELRLYVDGQLESLGAWSGGTPTREFGVEPWRIGTAKAATNSDWGFPAEGHIDDVRIYASALDDAGIAALALGRGAGNFAVHDGTVVIEAENYSGTAPGSGTASAVRWVPDTGRAGFSGISALQALPNAGVQSGDTRDGPRLDYTIDFEAGGVYRVWVRMWGERGGNGSVHVGIDGQPLTFGAGGVSDASGSWRWIGAAGADAVTFQVESPGTRTINLWMLEDGTRVDRILLTDDPGFVPSGAGPPETPRGDACVTSGAPAAVTGLRFAGDPRLVSWNSTAGAGGYDVIKGLLEPLRVGGGDFGASVSHCLLDHGRATWVLDDPSPAPGSAFYYVARAASCRDQPGTYGPAEGQPASRDIGIANAAAACP